MDGERGVDDGSRGEQSDIALLFRRMLVMLVNPWDHGWVVMERVGDAIWRSVPSRENVVVLCARGSIKGAGLIPGE